jgi:hypothetical protein
MYMFGKGSLHSKPIRRGSGGSTPSSRAVRASFLSTPRAARQPLLSPVKNIVHQMRLSLSAFAPRYHGTSSTH